MWCRWRCLVSCSSGGRLGERSCPGARWCWRAVLCSASQRGGDGTACVRVWRSDHARPVCRGSTSAPTHFPRRRLRLTPKGAAAPPTKSSAKLHGSVKTFEQRIDGGLKDPPCWMWAESWKRDNLTQTKPSERAQYRGGHLGLWMMQKWQLTAVVNIVG